MDVRRRTLHVASLQIGGDFGMEIVGFGAVRRADERGCGAAN